MEKTGILIMLTKVKACANLFVTLIGVVASVLFMGCSSKNPPKTSDAQMDTAMIYEDMPHEASVSKVGIDSSHPHLSLRKKLMPLLLLILASIHIMMQDMIRVRRMGIMMVSRIYEAILTMMLADIRERKGRNMSWGMKKDMMPVLMMFSLIETVILRRKNSLLQS